MIAQPAPRTISDVVACNLCTGCGACARLFPNAIRMIEDEIEGRRPVVAEAVADRAALSVCAGIGRRAPKAGPETRDEIDVEWGPVLKTWEGHAADPEIRHRGSSGGAVTALALFALKSGAAEQVAHIAARPGDARLSDGVLSRSRAELLRGAGSRYAQASPCETLGEIAEGTRPTLMIGKPCDIASTRQAEAMTPALKGKLPLTIAIFCAGAPNLVATERLLDRLDVPRQAPVTGLRYRGAGWPGLMQARWQEPDGAERVSPGIPYATGWGDILQTGRRWRCRICDDHTGAFADISVGDPWHNPPEGDVDAGRSMIVARSAAGVALVEAAIAAGALVAAPRARAIIAEAQPNLVATNAAVWGRRLAMRLLGMAVPAHPLGARFGSWWTRLSPRAKAQSVAGSLRRILRGGLRQAPILRPMTARRAPARQMKDAA